MGNTSYDLGFKDGSQAGYKLAQGDLERMRTAEQERDQYGRELHEAITCINAMETAQATMKTEIESLRAQLKAAQEQEPVAVLFHQPDDPSDSSIFDHTPARHGSRIHLQRQSSENWACLPVFAAPIPAQPSPAVAVPDFLIEMSKQMREQDNRCTSHPFFQVRCKRYVVTEQGYNDHHWEIIGDDGVVYSSLDPVDDLYQYLSESHSDFVSYWNKENHVDDISEWFDPDGDHLPDGLRKIYVQEIEEVVSTHLTEAGAGQFIARKQHDYPKLYTYAESAYWSPQLRQLQDWIISLPNIETPSPRITEQDAREKMLKKPAMVNATTFREGVSERLVVEAAQRYYEFRQENPPEKDEEFRNKFFEAIDSVKSIAISEQAALEIGKSAMASVKSFTGIVEWHSHLERWWENEGCALLNKLNNKTENAGGSDV